MYAGIICIVNDNNVVVLLKEIKEHEYNFAL